MTAALECCVRIKLSPRKCHCLSSLRPYRFAFVVQPKKEKEKRKNMKRWHLSGCGGGGRLVLVHWLMSFDNVNDFRSLVGRERERGKERVGERKMSPGIDAYFLQKKNSCAWRCSSYFSFLLSCVSFFGVVRHNDLLCQLFHQAEKSHHSQSWPCAKYAVNMNVCTHIGAVAKCGGGLHIVSCVICLCISISRVRSGFRCATRKSTNKMLCRRAHCRHPRTPCVCACVNFRTLPTIKPGAMPMKITKQEENEIMQIANDDDDDDDAAVDGDGQRVQNGSVLLIFLVFLFFCFNFVALKEAAQTG